MDIGRIYDLLQTQNQTMAAQGALLAEIKTSQSDMKERLFGTNGQPGAIQYLHNEHEATREIVAGHTKQLSLYRGVFAVVTFLLSATAAWAGILLKRR